MIWARPFWAALVLAFVCAACERAGNPLPTALPANSAATSAAATSNARVEAWAAATGTALRLAAKADQTPTAPPLTAILVQPPATADLGICNFQATDCGPIVNSPTAPSRATATPLPPTATPAPATPLAPPTARPAPVPATASPSAADCYNKPCQWELIAPNGQGRWPETCTSMGLDLFCFITFPNGQVTATFGWHVTWSADGQFLAVPEGGTHDSYATGYEIWNMAAGTRTARIEYNFDKQWWSPTGHAVAYVKKLASGLQEFHLLDAATGDDQLTRQCAKWATDQLKNSDYFDWRTACDNWTPAAGQPVIVTYTVAPTEVNPGGAVTLSWTSSGSTSAAVWPYLADRSPVPIAVPVSGTLVITVPTTDRLSDIFELRVTDSAGESDSRSQTVNIRCPDAFFFTAAPPPASAGCPYLPPALVAAAEQPFEHGRMIWLAPIPGGQTGSGTAQGASVYVLYDTSVLDFWPVWHRYDDTWAATEPEFDPTLEAPSGLFQPRRGFGKVWRENPDLRQKLGWATAPEQGFAGAYQVMWDLGPRPSDFYLRAADGSILHLGLNGYWEKWQP